MQEQGRSAGGHESRARTLGDLRASGYRPRTVREEMRANLIKKIRTGEALFPGVVGYDQTVIPQIENAILSGQDIIFLGERGQAKTRLARSLTNLLDDEIPVVAGSEINDDPFEPISKLARDLVAELRETGRGHEAYVTGAEDGKFHVNICGPMGNRTPTSSVPRRRNTILL